MLARRALLLPLLAALPLAGCDVFRPPQPGAGRATASAEPPSPAPGPADTGAQTPVPPPEVKPAPPPAAVREAVELPPGDAASPAPLSAEGETLIDPASALRVVLAGPCHDARLLLLDAAGAAVPASEQSEVGATTVLTLTPAALNPGTRYQLRLDGAIGREFHLGDQPYPPVRWSLRTAGDPNPPPRATTRSRTKRKRR